MYYSNRRIGIGADSHMPAPRLLARRAQKKKAATATSTYSYNKGNPLRKKKGFVLYIKKKIEKGKRSRSKRREDREQQDYKRSLGSLSLSLSTRPAHTTPQDDALTGFLTPPRSSPLSRSYVNPLPFSTHVTYCRRLFSRRLYSLHHHPPLIGAPRTYRERERERELCCSMHACISIGAACCRAALAL